MSGSLIVTKDPAERDLQHAVYDYRRHISAYPLLIPNIYCWSWESDLLYITKNNFAVEYEIKLTHSDFLADANKIHKHTLLAGNRPPGEPRWRMGLIYDPAQETGPVEFYYVCPVGVIGVDELPGYAGLFYAEPRKYAEWEHREDWLSDFRVKLIKKAKRRRLKPFSETQMIALLSKGLERYWRLEKRLRRATP
ncbi:MAG: hypothetical protein ABIH23_16895 [bacterium]